MPLLPLRGWSVSGMYVCMYVCIYLRVQNTIPTFRCPKHSVGSDYKDVNISLWPFGFSFQGPAHGTNFANSNLVRFSTVKYAIIVTKRKAFFFF
jgi:hypothetical protein